ncbi:hypothetical protein ACFE04_022873 [Oxalis oulophora]
MDNNNNNTNIQPKKRVTVCGGGVIGVCTAYFLAKNGGAAVTLIEKSSIACAASGKAGGFLALDWCDGGPLASLARASFDLHRSLADELNGAEAYGYRPLTTLSLTVTEPGGKEGYRGSKSKSVRSSLPDWIDGPAETPATIGTAHSTAQVHPLLFTRKLLSEAVEKFGLEVVIGKVERVGTESGRVNSVVIEGGRVIDSDAVVLALGPWSSKFEMLGSLFRVYGLKAHSIVIEPKEPAAITPHALFLSYYPAHGGRPMDPEVYPRPTGNNSTVHNCLIRGYCVIAKLHTRGDYLLELATPCKYWEVYVCGMSSQVEVPDDPEQIVGDPESIQVLKRVASTVSSHLGQEAKVKAEQACFLPCTDDSAPVIGEIPGVKCCYVATGHNCWGILNGPATGAAMAELIMDGHAKLVDLSKFSPARFGSS